MANTNGQAAPITIPFNRPFIAGKELYYIAQAVVLFVTAKITVPGFASIITAVLILGGIQLLALGMIGEYLGRVHLNINRKPQYTIRDVRRLSAPANVVRPARVEGNRDL